jgi:hypothetical protein
MESKRRKVAVILQISEQIAVKLEGAPRHGLETLRSGAAGVPNTKL